MNKEMLKLFILVGIVFAAISLIGIYQHQKDLQNDIVELKESVQVRNDEIDKKDEKINELSDKIVFLLEQVKKLENEKKELTKPMKYTSNKNPTRGQDDKMHYIGIFEATAYDDSPESQGKWVGQTATGRKPQVGVIAVDPKVIPLGTELFVEGYGKCVAGDTGGAIKGRRLDLFFNTKSEVYNWGRKKVKVYKLSE